MSARARVYVCVASPCVACAVRREMSALNACHTQSKKYSHIREYILGAARSAAGQRRRGALSRPDRIAVSHNSGCVWCTALRIEPLRVARPQPPDASQRCGNRAHTIRLMSSAQCARENSNERCSCEYLPQALCTFFVAIYSICSVTNRNFRILSVGESAADDEKGGHPDAQSQIVVEVEEEEGHNGQLFADRRSPRHG